MEVSSALSEIGAAQSGHFEHTLRGGLIQIFHFVVRTIQVRESFLVLESPKL